jgi:hypothetical protein
MDDDGGAKQGYPGQQWIDVDIHLRLPIRLFYFILGYCATSGVPPEELFNSALMFALNILFGELASGRSTTT